jgi:lantibiotic modifying enzyme
MADVTKDRTLKDIIELFDDKAKQLVTLVEESTKMTRTFRGSWAECNIEGTESLSPEGFISSFEAIADNMQASIHILNDRVQYMNDSLGIQ